MDINLSLQIHGCYVKRTGLGKYQQREWTHSLFAVPIVRNHLAVVELTPRSKCVYTRHPDLCHATSAVLTSQPLEHAKIGMRVKMLSDRRHKKTLRVNTASGANWLKRVWQISDTLKQHYHSIAPWNIRVYTCRLVTLSSHLGSICDESKGLAQTSWLHSNHSIVVYTVQHVAWGILYM